MWAWSPRFFIHCDPVDRSASRLSIKLCDPAPSSLLDDREDTIPATGTKAIPEEHQTTHRGDVRATYG